jgi:hypothetical protein
MDPSVTTLGGETPAAAAKTSLKTTKALAARMYPTLAPFVLGDDEIPHPSRRLHVMRSRLVVLSAALIAAAPLVLGCSGNSDARKASSSADTSGSGVCTDNLQATDGTPITFGYEVQNSGDQTGAYNEYDAGNASISLSGGFSGSEQVTCVVLLFEFDTLGGIDTASLQSTQNLSFTYDGDGEAGSWVAQLDALPMFNATAGGSANLFFYQFAFSINGNWLTDPISQSHNFQFVPSQQAQGTCQGVPNGFASSQ